MTAEEIEEEEVCFKCLVCLELGEEWRVFDCTYFCSFSLLLLFIDFHRPVCDVPITDFWITVQPIYLSCIKYCDHLAKVFDVTLCSFYPILLYSMFFFIGKLLKVGDVIIANLQIVFYFILFY